jgi:hypothetical protein
MSRGRSSIHYLQPGKRNSVLTILMIQPSSSTLNTATAAKLNAAKALLLGGWLFVDIYKGISHAWSFSLRSKHTAKKEHAVSICNVQLVVMWRINAPFYVLY